MKVKSRKRLVRIVSTISLLFILCVSASLRLAFPPEANAQVRAVNDYGALGLGRLLKKLNTTASVMMIGAHPDDEDSALLAYLARGENARTAYLSLTRGDGGQNIIGAELFESLGVIRTEELLQARRLDGAEQYFTRAFDYGFSKTLAEARQKWDEKVIVCDTVRAIRTFRPLVVISRFSGTPADGHGQHQYSGYITPIAVKAAADPKQCTDSGEPWQVQKFYVEQGFGGNDTASLKLNTGAYDPILGRSYFEIAMEGRSQHRSQGEGRIEFHGDQFSRLNLIESKAMKVIGESGVFAGIDGLTGFGIPALTASRVDPTTGMLMKPLLSTDPTFWKMFGIAASAGDFAFRDLQLSSMRDSRRTLLEGLKAIRGAREKLRDSIEHQDDVAVRTDFYLAQKEAEFSKAMQLETGVTVDALVDQETVVPGDEMMISVKVFKPRLDQVKIGEISLAVPAGWEVTKTDPPQQNNAAFSDRESSVAGAVFIVKVDNNVTFTQPYWLRERRDGDLFRWPKSNEQTLPFGPQPLVAQLKVTIEGIEITIEEPVRYRFADPTRGEIRREVNVVPSLSVSLDQKLLIIPQSAKAQTRHLTMSITNNSSVPTKGVADLNFNGAVELKSTSSSNAFELKSKGEKTSVGFDVTVPANFKPGNYEIFGNAIVGESHFNQEMHIIAYPHTQTHRFYTRAETVVNVIDLRPLMGKIGYIMGSGDDVAEAIRQMGINVTMLGEKDLASGDLSKYDSIVVGIRASETRPDFVANNQRLLDYVKNGGNLIVQYQRPSFAQQNLAPYPINMADTQRTAAGSIARVVDENAKVTILQPNHPIFNFPNKISDDDFKGWVQERNAYNFTTFDAQYTPMLESHDAGEQENKGGLVVARLGKGTWTYCSYSFFRQLPAGVSGAYRLFANMLSLSRAKK